MNAALRIRWDLVLMWVVVGMFGLGAFIVHEIREHRSARRRRPWTEKR